MSGVFPNVRGALAFAVESQDEITAAVVAPGVLELDDGTSAEPDRQTLHRADGESVDVVTSAGGDRDFESWRKLHTR